MTHFYIIEIQIMNDESAAHLVHHIQNEDPMKAMLQAESTYHQVLASAAISELPSHAAIMIREDGTPVQNKCYRIEAGEIE